MDSFSGQALNNQDVRIPDASDPIGFKDINTADATTTVKIKNASDDTIASIFSNNTGTVQANPYNTGANGEFVFYAANGRYNIVINEGLTDEVIISDVVLFDFNDLEAFTTGDLINNAQAATAAGSIIRTSGFFLSGDGGAGHWKLNGVTGQTVSQSPAQLGDALLNDGNGNQWALVSEGVVRLSQLGNTAAAFPALVKRLSPENNRFTNGDVGVVDIAIDIDSTLTVARQGVTIRFDAFVKPSGSFNTGDYMVDITASGVTILNAKLNCNKVANGIRSSAGNSRIRYPQIYRFKDFGALSTSGDFDIKEPDIFQWFQGDPEFASDVNFTGIGIQLEANDANVSGGRSYWCAIPLVTTSTCNFPQIKNGFHPFNGRPSGGARVDPKIMELDGNGIIVRDCYLDNGQVDILSDNCSIKDCTVVEVSGAVSYTDDRIIGVFATAEVSPNIEIEVIVGLKSAGTSTIKFLDKAPNSWVGDYTAINANTAGKKIAVSTLTSDTVDASTSTIYVPGTELVEIINIAGDEGERITKPTASDFVVRFKHSTLANDVKFFIGGSDNGMTVDSSERIIVYAGGVPRWEFVNNGVLRPVADGVDNVGAPSNRIKTIHSNMDTFADDTAAGVGGLTAGEHYQTATGELRVKL